MTSTNAKASSLWTQVTKKLNFQSFFIKKMKNFFKHQWYWYESAIRAIHTNSIKSWGSLIKCDVAHNIHHPLKSSAHHISSLFFSYWSTFQEDNIECKVLMLLILLFYSHLNVVWKNCGLSARFVLKGFMKR